MAETTIALDLYQASTLAVGLAVLGGTVAWSLATRGETEGRVETVLVALLNGTLGGIVVGGVAGALVLGIAELAESLFG